MVLCRREHILDLLLVKYVDACEKQNPGLVDRTIEAVSGEIADASPTGIRSRGHLCRSWCAT